MTELFEFLGRHLWLSLALAGITLALVYTELSRFWQGFKALKPGELTALVNRENALVIDIRAMNEFQQGHVSGSKNVLMSQFDPESKLLASAKSLPVVVVCKTGMTAAGAAKRLVKAGFEKVYVLDGGIAAWQQADLPLVKGRG
ncbi:rhodanese-like domain-containing protein [Lysobacter pythonis]|uniref:Rhodanese-like domain-containing protein n=1 Tax=Solilutibacter pythonis TaxID=2483112 RepID=A0A3M2HTX2_9GAMM|nr:rhodanese-like domain-containing protein [Lysobacter pythonis]RMH93171.1 rhodanese-like domain-containing protein [Lysobacter pythonis]